MSSALLLLLLLLLVLVLLLLLLLLLLPTRAGQQIGLVVKVYRKESFHRHFPVLARWHFARAEGHVHLHFGKGCTWEDNIKMDLQEVGCGVMD